MQNPEYTGLLSTPGFDVVLAENGRDCLVALEKGAFDLVLMDIVADHER